MRFILTLFVLVALTSIASTQILIIPSNISIKEPKMGFLGEMSLIPVASQFVGGEMFHERNVHFSEMISMKMNAWLKQTYSNAIIYDPQDSIVNLNKLKGAIIREMPVYDIHHTKALFGSSGYKPKEGANTQYYLTQLKEAYDVEYVVFVFANSVYKENAMFFSTEFPEYAGHSAFYGVVLDTETGHIEIICNVFDKKRAKKRPVAPGFSSSSYVEHTPIFKKVDEDYIEKRCKKIQNKLARKINKLK